MKLDEVQAHMDKMLPRATVLFKFENDNDNEAHFNIVTGKKNLSGKIKLNKENIVLSDIMSNYKKGYSTTLINKSFREFDYPYEVFEREFFIGDTVFLHENENDLVEIFRFYYYGFNHTITCDRMYCKKWYEVTYKGLEEKLTICDDVRTFAKYEIIET